MLTPAKTSKKRASGPDPGIVVEVADVDVVVRQMEVGAFYTFSDVYAEYVRNVENDGRAPAHWVSFAKMLAVQPDIKRLRACVVLDGGKSRQVRGVERTA